MALSRNDKLHIEQLLARMSKTLRNKGYKLYAEGGCSFIEYYDDTNEYEFSIQGNIEPQYAVFICLDGPGADRWFADDLYSCECLYFEDNLECKHVAAALYYLAVTTRDLKSTASLTSPKGSSNQKAEPIVIHCDPNDPQDILDKIRPKRDISDFYPTWKMPNSERSNSLITSATVISNTNFRCRLPTIA